MSFTPWTLFTDLGLVALLLLGGQLLRAKVPPVQRLFLPANVLAGLAGLALGPNGADILPFSDAIGKYPGILIALIFASLPFSSREFSRKSGRATVAELWSYSTLTILLQWGLGLLFALVLLRAVWPALHPGFGAILASGFVGGHGTAAAVGAAFAERGWDEAGSLAMTAATIGIICAIVGGMIWINWGAKRGATRYIARFEELPQELRTGLIPEERRPALGRETISPISLDPLVFHFALICAAAVSDWRVAEPAGQKRKKNGGGAPALALTENPDVLATLAAAGNARPTLVVGFAAETERVIEHAREKREKKGCDWILANDVGPGTGTFGGEMNTIHLVEADAVESWPRMTKAQVAEKLADRIAERLGEAE